MSNWKMYLISSLVILITSGLIFLIKETSIKNNFSGYQISGYELSYNIANPDTAYIMPRELREISGLSYHGDDQVLAVNDEKGFLYDYDLKSGKAISKIDFGKNGDYESVTRDGNTIYIGESNGNIKVVDLRQGKKIDEYTTPLKSSSNVEGMCFDSTQNQLLLACKGRLIKKVKDKHAKGIYTFDLATKQMSETPFKMFDLNEEYKALTPLNLSHDQISRMSIGSRLKSFAPSGIAINPISSDIYVISSRGKILTIMNRDKTVQGIYFLPKHIYGQPEGISFDDEGNMYISNEANSTRANILKIARNENRKATIVDTDDKAASIPDQIKITENDTVD